MDHRTNRPLGLAHYNSGLYGDSPSLDKGGVRGGLRSFPSSKLFKPLLTSPSSEGEEHHRIICYTALAASSLILLALCFSTTACKKDRPSAPLDVQKILTCRSLGLAYLEESRLEDAKTQFKQLTELAPQEALGYADLALTLLRMGNYPEAEVEARKALAKDDNPDVRLILGEIYESSGKLQQALGELQAGLRENSNHVQTHFKISQIYSRGGTPDSWQKREPHLTKVLDVMPGNLAARLQLVDVLVHNQKADAASVHLEEIRKQISELPADSSEFLSKTLSLLHAGKAADALVPAMAFHNLLKPTPLYQASIIEFNGPGGGMIGFPIVHFSKSFSTQNKTELHRTLRFTDVTQSSGLDVGNGFAFGDYDADGDPDLYISGAGRLFRNDRGVFRDVTKQAEIQSGSSLSGIFVDHDNDGDLDLYVVRLGPDSLYSNTGAGKFKAVQGALPEAEQGILCADLDHEGDLDFYALNRKENRAYRNNSDGTFTEVSKKMRISAGGDSRDADYGDFDDDGDLDLFVANRSASNILYTNLRQGQFQDTTAASGLLAAGGSEGVAVGDYDNDGFVDLFLSGQNSVLYHNKGNGTFEKDSRLKSVESSVATFFDFDNDGFLDLVAVGAGGFWFFRNRGSGIYVDASSLLPRDVKGASRVAVSDFDSDGDLDLFIVDLQGKVRVFRCDGWTNNHWLDVQLTALGPGSGKNNRYGIGAKLEVKAGDLYQMQVVTQPVSHFGLGPRSAADVLRIVWTNGVPQNHIQPAGNRRIVEQQVLKGSCAFLYAWDGQKYSFVTDVLWKSALGMPLGIMGGTTRYAFPNSSDEFLKIPGDRLKPKQGMYSLQITEELWETPYLDKSRLIVVDHANTADIYVDEKFTPPPFPPLRIFSVTQKFLPLSARDENGNDLLSFISKKDDRYVSDLTPGKYQGITEMHDLILDFGKLQPGDQIVLFLNGWIFPSDASINVSVSQSSQTRVVAPHLQVLDRNGNWTTAVPDLSFPMGKNKTVVADLAGKFQTEDYRIRIRTNMQVYWDHIFFSKNEPGTALRLATLKPSSADLHYRGFSRMFRKGIYGPHWFDYSQVTTQPQWCDLEGDYTRYGDVTSLLMESDDRSVIFNAGDEITIRFDMKQIPELPVNWSRDFLLYSDGWLKDGDLNTAFSQTVDPLPFHGMSSYPYGSKESYPSDQVHRDYLKNYNTRHVTRNCNPLRKGKS